MTTYLKKDIENNYISFPKALDKKLYSIGTSWEDFINGKWVKLNQEQVKFLTKYPGARAKEIYDCKIDSSRIEETIYEHKSKKIKELESYDKSPEVNVFFINDKPVWWDKEKRNGLLMRLMAEESCGKTNTTFWLSDMKVDLQISEAYKILYSVENYAILSYDNTQSLLFELKGLSDITQIDNFDYKRGYPNKLRFKIC